MTNRRRSPRTSRTPFRALHALLASVATLGSAALAACGSDAPYTPGSGGPGGGVMDSGASADSAPAETTDTGAAPPPDLDASTPVVDGSAPHDASGDGASGRDLSTDRTKFFGASRCAQSGLQLCEDFESGTLDTKTWTVSGTAPVIDAMHPARGSKALHVKVSGNGLSYIKESKTFPAPNNTYFGRAFVYFQSLPASPLTYAHWTMLAASGTGVSGEIRVSGQLQNGNNLFGVGTDNRVDDAGTGDWTTSDADPSKMPRAVPTGEWLCIEWMHKGDTNETRFYWDATEHPSLHTTPTMSGSTTGAPYILPQFTNVWVGWQEYQTSTEPFELWVDEIGIDPARIGCVL